MDASGGTTSVTFQHSVMFPRRSQPFHLNLFTLASFLLASLQTGFIVSAKPFPTSVNAADVGNGNSSSVEKRQQLPLFGGHSFFAASGEDAFHQLAKEFFKIDERSRNQVPTIATQEAIFRDQFEHHPVPVEIGAAGQTAQHSANRSESFFDSVSGPPSSGNY